MDYLMCRDELYFSGIGLEYLARKRCHQDLSYLI